MALVISSTMVIGSGGHIHKTIDEDDEGTVLVMDVLLICFYDSK